MQSYNISYIYIVKYGQIVIYISDIFWLITNLVNEKHIMNIAYIDHQNIKLGIKELWREVDWKSFYIYLKMKYEIDIIKFFVWYIESNNQRYQELKDIWYDVIFKKTLSIAKAEKWNVDTMIMLHGITDTNKGMNFWLLVSWDWDFEVLIEYWISQNINYKIMIPNHKKASQLLKEVAWQTWLINMSDLSNKIKKTT